MNKTFDLYDLKFLFKNTKQIDISVAKLRTIFVIGWQI